MEKLHTLRPAQYTDALSMARITIAGHRQVVEDALKGGQYSQLSSDATQAARAAHAGIDQLFGRIDGARDDPLRYRTMVAQKIAGSGVVGLLIAERVPGEYVELNRLFVHPVVQGRGIGSDLLEDFSSWAGNELQRLDVVTTNAGAIALYERWGFELVPGTEDEIPPLTYMRMEKQLGESTA